MNKILAKLKILSVLVAIVLMFTCAGVFAAAKDDPRAELDAAFKSMENLTNGNLILSGVLDTAIFDSKAMIDMSVFTANKEDGVAKGTLTLVTGSGAEATTDRYPFYLTVDKEKSVLYYQEKNQWYKDETKFDDEKKKSNEDSEKLPPQEEKKITDLSDKLIKSVTRGAGTADTQDYVVTIDGKILAAITRLSVTLAPQDKVKETKADETLTEENLLLLDKIRDFSGTVSVDKTTGMVKKISVDLSRPAIDVANGFIDSRKTIDESAKEAFKGIVASSKVVLEVEGDKYNQVGKIVVPDDVLKNAKSAPKEKKDEANKTNEQ